MKLIKIKCNDVSKEKLEEKLDKLSKEFISGNIDTAVSVFSNGKIEVSLAKVPSNERFLTFKDAKKLLKEQKKALNLNQKTIDYVVKIQPKIKTILSEIKEVKKKK